MPTIATMLPRLLVQQKHLREAQAEELMQSAKGSNIPFAAQLIKAGLARPLDLAILLSEQLALPYLDLSLIDPSSVLDRVDLRLMAANRFLPLARRGGEVHVALSDPSSENFLQELRFQLQATSLRPIVVEEDKLDALLAKIIEQRDATLSRSLSDDGAPMADLLAEASDMQEIADEPAPTTDVDDAPIVKYLQKVLLDAINANVSDIHFEPYEKYFRIRFRQDGQLYEYVQLPLAIKEKLASRIKVISRLDISEKRLPQDGRLKLTLYKNRSIDFRVSTLPTLFGEKIVMRILDPSNAKVGIDALGYEPDQRDLLIDAVKRPHGMVLVTGPTGSGKTVSLYTCLNLLNEPSLNISTAEDPAEINLPGVNQVNVNERAGLTFSVALRSFLRQDPDVIMVGEVRDLETADIAIKAALTGHMVLSTLHTNSAPETLTRLVDMGVAPFNIASAVSLITAQRLARRLCPHCKQAKLFEPNALRDVGFTDAQLVGYGQTWKTFEPVGCDKCKDGYKGRVGIYQVMPVTEEMRSAILNGGNALQIAHLAEREGVRDLRQSGLLKVIHGMTSVEEILGATNE
jgi:type IV pilus assembly protein PilB